MTRNGLIDKIIEFENYNLRNGNGVLSFVKKDDPYKQILLSSKTLFLVDNYSEDSETFVISSIKNIEEKEDKVIITLFDGESKEF